MKRTYIAKITSMDVWIERQMHGVADLQVFLTNPYKYESNNEGMIVAYKDVSLQTGDWKKENNK